MSCSYCTNYHKFHKIQCQLLPFDELPLISHVILRVKLFYELPFISHGTFAVAATVRVTINFTRYNASYYHLTSYLYFHMLFCELKLFYELPFISHFKLAVAATGRITINFTRYIASYCYLTSYLLIHMLYCKLLLIQQVTL